MTQLKTLIATVSKLDDECSLSLSSKQQDWLDDMIYAYNHGHPERISESGRAFLQKCADGAYSCNVDVLVYSEDALYVHKR